MDFKVFVEIPAQGSVKYEVDEDTGELVVDRFLHTAMYYPFNYGFIKDTKGEDEDPLDVIVLSIQPAHPGTIIKCYAIGLLEMKDEGGIDTKIIAVPNEKIDPEFGRFTDIKDISQHTKDKIKHFFDHMKDLEKGKWVKTGSYKGKKEAEKEISKAKLS